MAFASKAVARAITIRIHTGECVCEGRLEECPVFAQNKKSRRGASGGSQAA